MGVAASGAGVGIVRIPGVEMGRREPFMRKPLDASQGRWFAAGPGIWLLLAVQASAAPPARALDPQDLADRIDRHLAARWDEVGARPAPPADDSEFLRRAYLDLTGRVPPIRD